MSFGIVYMLITVLAMDLDEMKVIDINLKSCRQNQGHKLVLLGPSVHSP